MAFKENHKDLTVAIDTLDHQPSPQDVNKYLNWLAEAPEIHQPGPLAMRAVSVILSKTVPELVGLTSIEDDESLAATLRSLPGIGAILNQLKALLPDLPKSKLQIQSLLGLLSNVVNKKDIIATLTSYNSPPKRLVWQDIVSIFAGSRLLSCVTQVDLALCQFSANLPKDSSWAWLANAKSYTSFLSLTLLDAAPLLEASSFSSIFSKSLYLSNAEDIFGAFANRNAFKYLLPNHLTLRNVDRNRLVNVAINWLFMYLVQDPSDERISACAELLSLLFTETDFNQVGQVLVNRALPLPLLKVCIGALCYKGLELNALDNIYKEWASQENVKHGAFAIQKQQTQILLLLCSRISHKQLTKFVQSPLFLNGISNHIGALSEEPRLYGIMVGEEMIAKAGTDTKLKFEMPLTNSEQAQQLRQLASWVPSSVQLWDVLESPIVEEPASLEEDEEIIRDPIKESENPIPNLMYPDSDDEDEEFIPFAAPIHDPEDSDDDADTAVRNSEKPRPPVYLKQLIVMLQSEDYEQVKIALLNAEQLIYKKRTFGKELQFHGPEICVTLAALKDNFDIEDFDGLRLNCLISLVSSCPEIATDTLIDLLIQADLSLKERMSILSSLGLGARVLAGLDDERSIRRQNLVFASNKLPSPALHKKFLSREQAAVLDNDEVTQITMSLEKQALTETVEAAVDKTDIGMKEKAVNISRKLEKSRQIGTRKFAAENDLAKIAANTFFFKLEAAFIPLFGKSSAYGDYYALLISHYLRTLALILDASYPTCPDLISMSTSMLSIIQRSMSSDTITIEAIVTCLLVVLQINQPQRLVEMWPTELVNIRTWLENTWESIADERIKGAAAGALYKLNEILTHWERLLIESTLGIENAW